MQRIIQPKPYNPCIIQSCIIHQTPRLYTNIILYHALTSSKCLPRYIIVKLIDKNKGHANIIHDIPHHARQNIILQFHYIHANIVHESHQNEWICKGIYSTIFKLTWNRRNLHSRLHVGWVHWGSTWGEDGLVYSVSWNIQQHFLTGYGLHLLVFLSLSFLDWLQHNTLCRVFACISLFIEWRNMGK